MFDVLIKGGTIIDGTGNVGFKGSVAIEKDRLKIITGNTSTIEATSIIDASHYIVAPGFIDVHTHSDLIPLSEPLNEPKIMQGVTTEIVGLCGIGYAPLSKKNLKMMLLYYSGACGHPDIDYNWGSVAEFLQRFHHKVSGNIACFIPNSCLRVETVGWEDRPATIDDIRIMQDMIRQAMAEGALGLSSGLSYPPSLYARTDELIELCKIVAECGGGYATHVRYGLGDGIFDGFREALTIANRSGCPVQISHYFPQVALRGQTAMMLQFIDEARAGGVDITFDAYPYEFGSSTLASVVPLWAHNGGPYALLKRLKSNDDRDKICKSTKIKWPADEIRINAVKTARNKWCEGLTLATIADNLNKSHWDTICDLLIEENLEVSFTVLTGDMNDIRAMITHPAHMVGSDGLRIGSMPNPRTYGTFPKILGQLVRDEKVLPIEQAIRKMTSFPAQRFGLAGRGILRDDMKADIVVFDPLTVSGVATIDNPKQFPLGIEYVFVNGKLVGEKGRHTGALPGEPLTRGGQIVSRA